MFGMCGVCLTGNVRKFNIENSELQEMYQRLTSTELNTAVGVCETVCYICYSQLQRCRKFSEMAQKSYKWLRNVVESGIEVSQETIINQNRGRKHNLSITTIPPITIYHNSDCVKTQVIMKEEIIEIEENTSIEDGDILKDCLIEHPTPAANTLLSNNDSHIFNNNSGVDSRRKRSALISVRFDKKTDAESDKVITDINKRSACASDVSCFKPKRQLKDNLALNEMCSQKGVKSCTFTLIKERRPAPRPAQQTQKKSNYINILRKPMSSSLAVIEFDKKTGAESHKVITDINIQPDQISSSLAVIEIDKKTDAESDKVITDINKRSACASDVSCFKPKRQLKDNLALNEMCSQKGAKSCTFTLIKERRPAPRPAQQTQKKSNYINILRKPMSSSLAVIEFDKKTGAESHKVITDINIQPDQISSSLAVIEIDKKTDAESDKVITDINKRSACASDVSCFKPKRQLKDNLALNEMCSQKEAKSCTFNLIKERRMGPRPAQQTQKKSNYINILPKPMPSSLAVLEFDKKTDADSHKVINPKNWQFSDLLHPYPMFWDPTHPEYYSKSKYRSRCFFNLKNEYNSHFSAPITSKILSKKIKSYVQLLRRKRRDYQEATIIAQIPNGPWVRSNVHIPPSPVNTVTIDTLPESPKNTPSLSATTHFLLPMICPNQHNSATGLVPTVIYMGERGHFKKVSDPIQITY